MHNSPKIPVKIIGVGNAWRGDDAVGLLVARSLKQENLPQVEISENLGTASALADAWQDAVQVIVVDAVVAGAPLGAIFRLDAHNAAATFPVSRSPSSHGGGVAEAVALGRLFQELPPVLIIYGIEGENFSLGGGLSPAVAAAIPEAVRRITAEIRTWRGWQTGKAKKPFCHIPER